jgi:hypothetical protein
MSCLTIFTQLADQGLPVPLSPCNNCHGTIYKKDDWFQCPSCGALSTKYGGLFTHGGTASQEWIDSCKAADQFIAEYRIVE